MENNLNELDNKLEFELRCAVARSQKLPDAQKAFDEFALRNGKANRKLPFRRVAIYISLAVAACVAIFLIVSPMLINVGDAADGIKVYNALTADVTDVSILVDGVVIDTEKQEAKNHGISLGPNNDIAFEVSDAETLEEAKMTEVLVPIGKTAKLLLPDGSTVWIGANSSLIFPNHFDKAKERIVKLVGEAYFDVVHDDKSPFIVNCGSFSTKVLGTEFDVKNVEGEEPLVALVEGRVAVNRGNYEVILKPEQMVKVPETGGLNVEHADLEVVTSWKNGSFYFDGQTMREILMEVGRWYNMNVIFRSKLHIGEKIHFSAERSWSVKETVDCLNQLSDAKIMIEGNEIVVR